MPAIQCLSYVFAFTCFPMNNMNLTLILAMALSAIPLSGIANDTPAQANPFRQVPIPARAHGYSSFDTQVIHSKAELSEFLKSIRKPDTWDNLEGFENAISEAKLDFDREALVLLRHTERSGSIEVTFHPPILNGQQLICKLTRTSPMIVTADMAYYCYALVISKPVVGTLEVQFNGMKVAELTPST